MPKKESKKRPSARSLARQAARDRRTERCERRESMFDLIVSGFGYEKVAERMGVSVATLRREVDRVLAARAPNSSERYVGMQIARLQKALLVVDHALDTGDLRAVPALATLLGQFDRYHGFAAALASRATPQQAVELQDSAPKALESQSR